MKVLVWCATAEDCRVFEQYNKGRIEFEYTPDTLTEENVSSCKGYEGIVIQTRCIIQQLYNLLAAKLFDIAAECLHHGKGSSPFGRGRSKIYRLPFRRF